MHLTLTQIGNSTGAIFPKEVLTALQLKKGDKLALIRTRTGYEIAPYDEGFEEQIEIMNKYANKYRNTLRKLAE